MAEPTPEEKAAQDAKDAAAKAAADKVAADKAAAEEAKKHVKLVHKDHGKLMVHPTTVDAHIKAGWTLAK